MINGTEAAAHGRAMMAAKLAMKVAPETAQEASKKESAPGQQAKAAIAEAREAGTELPKNIQGKVASAIARGIDPQTVFAALVEPQPEPVDETTEETKTVNVVDGEIDAEQDEAVVLTDEVEINTVSDAEAALVLLLEENGEESA
jgi:hypothetical protein